MDTIVPPKEIFMQPPQTVNSRISESGYDIPGFLKVGRNKDGEMLSFFDGFPLPRKGIVYNEAVGANNQVKRVTLSLISPFACKEMILPALGFVLIPFKWKISFLEKYLQNYIRLADSLYSQCERIPYLKKEYYTNCSKEVWTLTENFLVNLGITQVTASKIGHILATILEFDDAYRIRFIDPMSEFFKEEVIKNPVKFIERFFGFWEERDKNFEDKVSFYPKMKALSNIRYIFYHPKIKKAFQSAMKKANFKWLQLDEYEVFWNLNRADYDILGKDLETRYACFLKNIEDYKNEMARKLSMD